MAGTDGAPKGSRQSAALSGKLTICHVCVHGGHSALLPTAFPIPITALARLRQSGGAPMPALSPNSLASLRIGLIRIRCLRDGGGSTHRSPPRRSTRRDGLGPRAHTLRTEAEATSAVRSVVPRRTSSELAGNRIPTEAPNTPCRHPGHLSLRLGISGQITARRLASGSRTTGDVSPALLPLPMAQRTVFDGRRRGGDFHCGYFPRVFVSWLAPTASAHSTPKSKSRSRPSHTSPHGPRDAPLREKGPVGFEGAWTLEIWAPIRPVRPLDNKGFSVVLCRPIRCGPGHSTVRRTASGSRTTGDVSPALLPPADGATNRLRRAQKERRFPCRAVSSRTRKSVNANNFDRYHAQADFARSTIAHLPA